MIFQEVLKLKPNLLIIYSGDNEFLEPRLYEIGEHWYGPIARLANHAHVYRILRGNPLARRFFPENTLPAGHVAFKRTRAVEPALASSPASGKGPRARRQDPPATRSALSLKLFHGYAQHGLQR
jgi:hypothetical protein